MLNVNQMLLLKIGKTNKNNKIFSKKTIKKSLNKLKIKNLCFMKNNLKNKLMKNSYRTKTFKIIKLINYNNSNNKFLKKIINI